MKLLILAALLALPTLAADRTATLRHFAQVRALYGLGQTVAVVIEPQPNGDLPTLVEPRAALPRKHLRPNYPERILPQGSCDSTEECEAKTDEMCKDAGYADGVDPDTVTITSHYSGSKTCSGDCAGTSDRGTTGGVALVGCEK